MTHRIGNCEWGRCQTCSARIHGVNQAETHERNYPNHRVIGDWGEKVKKPRIEELMVEPVIETYGDEGC